MHRNRVLLSLGAVRCHLAQCPDMVGKAAGDGEPRMLFYCGEFLPAALRQVRGTEDEVRAAIRSAGVNSLDEVHAVVLETDGSFSVVPQGRNGSSLVGVNGPSAKKS